MPLARNRLVDTDTTPYYHCISRCVRRAYLCGDDRMTKRNFDHRKQWLYQRIKQLTSVFAIDVCAYAIMANHYHVVLQVNTKQIDSWSMDEVIVRWTTLFQGSAMVESYWSGDLLSESELDKLSNLVEVWRARLGDLSWFMRCLNEYMARRANAEDECTGRFWEGRFKSQALLDETALITCMTYVDLNPIRAGVCESLEDSDFTSIQERLRALPSKVGRDESGINGCSESAWLKPLTNKLEISTSSTIPMQHLDYIALVDWTGRKIQSGKHGVIPDHIQPILDRLDVDQKNWANSVHYFDNRFYRVLGRVSQIKTLARKIKMNWLNGMFSASRLYR